MRLFIYEYLCATGVSDSSLRREGWAMLSALVEDFAAVSGVRVFTLLERNAPHDLGHECRRIHADAEPDAFRECARETDVALVIAPEFDDLLRERSAWTLEQGSVLLGSGPEAIRLASDKANLGAVLTARGVAVPKILGRLLEGGGLPDFETFPVISRRLGSSSGGTALPSRPDGSGEPSYLTNLICKPRFGAGCRGIRWIEDKRRLHVLVEQAREEAGGAEVLLQAAAAGRAASVGFLIGSKETLPLRAGYQDVRREGAVLRYQGGTVPLPGGLDERAIQLAGRGLACFPGLRGYVGVDLVLGEAEDGSEDFVIEINPRPTTAYVGLRRLCVGNLAETWWRLSRGESVPPIVWRDGSLNFRADGIVM